MSLCVVVGKCSAAWSAQQQLHGMGVRTLQRVPNTAAMSIHYSKHTYICYGLMGNMMMMMSKHTCLCTTAHEP
jgi:hypothetical protein